MFSHIPISRLTSLVRRRSIVILLHFLPGKIKTSKGTQTQEEEHETSCMKSVSAESLEAMVSDQNSNCGSDSLLLWGPRMVFDSIHGRISLSCRNVHNAMREI